MRAAGSPPRPRSVRTRLLQRKPRPGSSGPISIPSVATRSDRLEDEVRLQAGLLGAPHYRPQKDRFEFATVIGEVTMRLAEDGNDLRHLKPKRSILVGERSAMALGFVFLPFGRVRPNLDALPSKESPVACASDGATHPEATLADSIHDRRARAIVVGPALHRIGRGQAFRAGGQQKPGNPGR